MDNNVPQELKEAQPFEKSLDGSGKEKNKAIKKPWSKPTITDMGKITVKDFIKVFRHEV
jgi:hypothetical protein